VTDNIDPNIDGDIDGDIDTEELASASRIECAAALRELGHAIVGHVVDDEMLDEIASFVRDRSTTINRAASRSRPTHDLKRRMFDEAPADGAGMTHYPDCVVSGPANPMGINIACHRDGDAAVGTISLGAAFEGAPGRAHGGVVAAIFDDVMGFVLSIERTPAFTGRLCVSYLAPTPLETPLEFRAWLREREGRKLFIEGTASTADGEKILEADGIFISIPADHFAEP
jgi:acyl-coenzyme A thioesterase PaaI-like protein